MTEEYTTVFEASYLSNGSLLTAVLFLSVGVLVVVFVTHKTISGRMKYIPGMFFYFLWVPLWFIVGGACLFSIICEGRDFTVALRSGRCELVEGTVSVIHGQPKSGHDAGDHIRISNKEFIYNYFSMGLGYKQTISHGGWLTNGVSARLYYLGNTILKVEIKH
jgi:hypothetical protein